MNATTLYTYATLAPIALGDLLVTGTKPGTAMKSEPMRMNGREFHQPGSGVLRERLAGLVNHLRLLKVTTMMTHEIAQIVGAANQK